MPIWECIKSHTYRQYLSWLEWMADDYNSPSRLDYYLMQIAYEVRRGLSRHPSSVKQDTFKIKFKRKSQSQGPKLSPQERGEASKSAWMGALGMTTDGKKISDIRESIKRRNQKR